MRIPLAVGLSLLTCVPASGQTQVVLDLAGTGGLSQTVEPDTYTVVLQNRLPQARYQVVVKKELIPIAAIAFDPVGSLGGLSRNEVADPCPALTEATTALTETTAEAQVPSRRAALQALLAPGGCAAGAGKAAAEAALASTSQTLSPPQVLRDGERLTVTVTRAAGDSVLTWTLVLETEPRGEWLTSFGVSFLPDRDQRYHTEAAGEDKFTIVEDTADRAMKPPMPSVYFSWLSSKQKRGNWSWSPTIGLGLDDASIGVFGGVSLSFNQNISVIGGVAIGGQKRLISRYTPGQEVGENLTDDQLHELDYRAMPVVALTVRFDRNPFKKEADTPAPAPETPAPGGETPAKPPKPEEPPAEQPGSGTPGSAPEASRESDLKIRFDARGALRDPAIVTTLRDRASAATDVFIISHGWWNDEKSADCFYTRMVGGIAGSTPAYLTADRYRPLFVTVYWPSALFPMEPSDCGPAGRTESAAVAGFDQERVGRWASLAFPDAVTRPAFGAETARAATLLERERTGNLSAAEAEELVGILVNWRGALDAAGEGAEAGAFTGSAHEIALEWSQRPEPRSELSLGTLGSKKWLNFGNAFTFWTMKQRAGVIGSTGLHAIVKTLQPLRAQKVRLHLIGHSFGGKLVTASLTGTPGSAPNHADSLVILQGAFSHFAFATKEQILAAGVRVDRGGLYRDALLSSLVAGPIVATHTMADVPNRLLYPLGVALVGDVTEAARAPRFGSLGANGLQGVASAPLVLKQKRLADLDDASARAISVDANGVVGGHSDLVKPQVFTLVWDAVEYDR